MSSRRSETSGWQMRLITVALLVAVLTAGCGSGGKHVALPPPNADPNHVVAVYLSALNAHDLSTARTLLTPAHLKEVQRETDSWFNDLKSVHLLRMSQPSVLHRTFPKRVFIAVGITAQWHQLGTSTNGPGPYSYYLIQSGPNKRRLIYNEGLG
jgi:hypothetical protein